MRTSCIPDMNFSIPSSGYKLLGVQRMVNYGEYFALVSVDHVGILALGQDGGELLGLMIKQLYFAVSFSNANYNFESVNKENK